MLGTYVLVRPKHKAKEAEIYGKPKQVLVQKSRAAGTEAMKHINIPREVMQADMDVMSVQASPGMAPRTVAVKKPRHLKPTQVKPTQVKPAQVKPTQYKPTQTTVKIDLSPSHTDKKELIAIKTSGLQNLPEGNFRNMFAGQGFVVEKASEGSITGFMQDVLLNIVKNSPNKKQAKKAYFRQLQDLEHGWLIYMEKHAAEFSQKTQGNLTAKQKQSLEYWKNYKKTHLKRGYAAKYLFKKFNKAKPGSSQFNYYNNLYQKGAELMNGLEELNPDILDVNSPGGQQVFYAKADKTGKLHVLKTLWDFASKMKLPLPERDFTTTGDITPMQPVKSEEVKKLAQKDKTMDFLDKMVSDIETRAASKQQAQTAKTMNFLDNLVSDIEQRAEQRKPDEAKIAAGQVKPLQNLQVESMIVDAPVDKNNKPSRSQSGLMDNNKGILNTVSRSQSGEIHLNKSKINLYRFQSGKIFIDSAINDGASKKQSGVIIGNQMEERTQAGTINVKESTANLSRSQSGEINIPVKSEEEPPKSFWSKTKDKVKTGAKKLWGKLFA
ncbi:hypothetical protein JW911_04870 [Candidatus Peregrinibacteria bacterium]|nr:hypothetical protein [Candidatus Peregrinibacteria bacterium]